MIINGGFQHLSNKKISCSAFGLLAEAAILPVFLMAFLFDQLRHSHTPKHMPLLHVPDEYIHIYF